MKSISVIVLSAACLALGATIGAAARDKSIFPGIELIRDKPAREAGLAALQEAETLAGPKGTWELISVARVYYLTGDKARGQALIDKVMSGKTVHSDWLRIGQLYADAGEVSKASGYFQRTIAATPRDDSGEAEIGAWYIRVGQREQGEALLAKAFAKNPDETWHYIRAAEGLLNVSPAL
jgi:tetratricopeptide (TPR) repeat protein